METQDALTRFFAARRRNDDGEQLLADLVADVAAGGGVAVLDDLLAAGHSRAVIAAALEPTGDDKRARPLLRGTVANGIEIVWCTTLGWSRAGQSNKREAPVGSRTARHRTAPALFERWLATRAAVAEPHGILLTLDRGSGLRSVVEEMTQRAWGLVRQTGGTGQDAALLLTRPVPDAIIIENWPDDPSAIAWRDLHVYPHFGSPERPRAEVAIAVEVQLSDTASAIMSQKVRAHDVAMRLGGGWQATLWVVDSQDVMTRLQRAGIGDELRHPGHYVVQAREVGLGDHEPLACTSWNWPALSLP